jgi:hypothetical protein
MFALIPWQAWAALAAAALVGVLLWEARDNALQLGRERERAAAEAIHRKAEKDADDATITVDHCYSLGRDWDRARGLCLAKRP